MLSAEWREQEYPEKHMDARHETQEQPRFEIELEACCNQQPFARTLSVQYYCAL